jgi:hypothetical protein
MKEGSIAQGLVGHLIPESNNAAGSIVNYQDREYIDFGEDISQTVDIRSQKSLFGRVDEFNNSIYPNVDKVLFDPKLRLFGFDFTLKLIGQFALEWSSVDNQVSQFSTYKNINFANKNFRSIEEAFQNYYFTIFDNFRREMFFTGDEVNILGFDGYVSKFASFLQKNKFVFTREALIRTDAYHPDNTLLIYNLQDEQQHGDDEKTVVDYYKDVSFDALGDFLIHHGLVLDRHSPWRFVVNIKSPQVVNPSEDRGMPWTSTTATTLLSDYFIPAYKTEAEIARKLLIDNYNEFVSFSTKKQISQCAVTLKPIQTEIKREFIENVAVVNLSVMNFLVTMRQQETGKNLSKSMKQKVFSELQGEVENVNAAYEVLHDFMKRKQLYVPPTFLDRIDALAVANYLNCLGAHRSAADGTWIPCKNPDEFYSKVKQRKGATALLESFLASINKQEVEEYQDQILDSIDPF